MSKTKIPDRIIKRFGINPMSVKEYVLAIRNHLDEFLDGTAKHKVTAIYNKQNILLKIDIIDDADKPIKIEIKKADNQEEPLIIVSNDNICLCRPLNSINPSKAFMNSSDIISAAMEAKNE